MINIDTLAVVLRVLGRTPAARPTAPTPVAAVVPPPRVAPGRELPVQVEQTPLAVDSMPTESLDSATERTQTTQAHAPRTAASAAAMASSRSAESFAPTGRVALSAAGSLLLDAMNVPHPEHGPVIRAIVPLLPAPPQEPAVLARAIEHAITRSGVFYDSHVARWTEQDFSTSELAHEPQAAWSTAPSPAGALGHATGASAGLPHADAPLLLRQQLEAHEAHRLALAAELWPGQRVQLVFEEPGHTRDHGRDDTAESHDRAWTTRVDLTLESLGHVTAVIGLRNNMVECQLSVSTRDAQSRLSEAQQDLNEALQRCSLELARCAVTHE